MLVEDTTIDNTQVSVDHDKGYDFGVVVGHDFGGFRLESEVSYREADLDEVAISTGTFEGTGEGNFLSFMLNGLLDFGDDDGLQGFVGGGFGVVRTDLSGAIDVGNADGRFNRVYDDSDTGFGWQILTGIRAPLSDDWDVGLKYRYFNAPGVSIVDVSGAELEGDIATHSLLGSLIYNFGGEAPPPPPPPPPPQAASARAIVRSTARRLVSLANRLVILRPL